MQFNSSKHESNIVNTFFLILDMALNLEVSYSHNTLLNNYDL